jgi:large subunit ribosomal protein L9
MELILREDIDKLGQRGQLVKVTSGYARNYLLPRKLAVAASESNKKIVEQERQAHLRRETKVEGEAQELAKLMSAAGDIVVALEKLGYTIDRKKIQLDDPIKTLGDFKVTVKLHRGVSLELPVHVVREE